MAKNPPLWQAQVKPGQDGLGTAWSCAHGLGRWTDDCGCGAEGKQQGWRRPLRGALDWLRDNLDDVFEEHGRLLFHEPWAARDAYIAVILDRSEAALTRYLAAHLRTPDSADLREKALSLLEMQRHCQLMYTSCGWFFSEISGIETVQNLQYAARAVELARRVAGAELERDFCARLRLAPSNVPELGDGEAVYRRLVLPQRVDEDRLAAHFAAALLARSRRSSGGSAVSV